jgi:hypothetical protein
MLRADNVICGTSSTGTGTLTLAACPAPPGGLDFDKWLKATGLNFVSGNALLVSYTIIEYTDSAFTTVKQTEKGVGTLTLGASISAATLARTTVQSTVTGMDTSTPRRRSPRRPRSPSAPLRTRWFLSARARLMLARLATLFQLPLGRTRRAAFHRRLASGNSQGLQTAG